MINIGFCDDDPLYLKSICTLAEQQLKKMNRAYDLISYVSGKKFLEEYGEGTTRYDLIFLDIEMPEIDGITLARKIREIDSNVTIILLTSREDKVYDAFGYNIYKFIRKGLSKEEFIKLFNECIEYVSLITTSYLFNTSEGKVKLKENEIIYIETKLRKFYLQTMGKRYRIIAESFGEVMEVMNHCQFLISPNRSCMVNLKNIKEVTKDGEVILRYGDQQESLPISRGRRKEVMSKFLEYIK